MVKVDGVTQGLKDVLTSNEDLATDEMKERAGSDFEPAPPPPAPGDNGAAGGDSESEKSGPPPGDSGAGSVDSVIDIIDAAVVTIRRAIITDFSIDVKMSENERDACAAAVSKLAPVLFSFMQNSKFGPALAFAGLIAANTIKLKNAGGEK